MFKELDKKMESFINAGVPFCDCIIMRNGECVYRKVLGYVDSDKKIKATGKEVYNIYSCTKLMTCIAALMLWEQGKFDLEDELYKFMPEFEEMSVLTENGVKPAENKITIRHLFTMTAGFSYDLDSPMILKCKEETGGSCKTRELMKYLAKEPLLFEPGTRWQYSLCHDVLAAFVEVISGMTFGEFVKKNIFDVCKMEHSTLLLSDDELGIIANQYRYDDTTNQVKEIERTNQFKLGTDYESGGAGCISTVEDYIKMLEALRTFKLLKKETVELLGANQLTEEQRQLPWYWVEDGRGYGLGQCSCFDKTVSADFGWGGAAGATYFVDIEKGLTMYLGAHVLNFSEYSGLRKDLTPVIQKIFE